ncbi:MAG TPA: M23 family metallopeptidase, partial [Jiangellaceae bacterium]|nr:M23 family metallopeptidase [Jiangellaceae bacterium]
QRLSSEPDRYRGRRRVPTPPRSRYAVVVTSAFVGAGVVALGASNMPDAKDINPDVLRGLERSSVSADTALTDRENETKAASRGDARGVDTEQVSAEEAAAGVWLLPLENYTFNAPYGVRWGKLHAGVDLAAPEGVVYKAIHAGEVIQSGYHGGYGYAVTIRDADGVEIIYAHSRRVLPKVGDQVKAGQPIGEVGSTGASFGTHLHVEVHVGGTPVDPIPFLRDKGVDVKLGVESVYAGMLNTAS